MRSTLVTFVALALAGSVSAGKFAPLPAVLAARAHSISLKSTSNTSSHVRVHRGRSKPARLDHRALDITLLVGQLKSLCGGLQDNQQAIHQTRQQIAKNPSQGKKYSHQLSTQVEAMRNASGGATPIISQLATALKPFGANEGKTYYDQSNAFETLLKDLVDATKYSLVDLTEICYEVPVLGPILGPIVFDLKCVLDELLNGLENTVDGLLGGHGLDGLQPLLGSLGDVLSSLNIGGTK